MTHDLGNNKKREFRSLWVVVRIAREAVGAMLSGEGLLQAEERKN